MATTQEEQETHINITADNRGTAFVWTDDPVWVRRLLQWFKPVRVDGDSYEFEVDTKMIVRENALVKGTKALGADVKPMPQEKMDKLHSR